MLDRFFRHDEVPLDYRANFANLYADMAWFGVLSGSAVNFLNVYAARLGASGLQIGLLAAVSAVVNLLFAIPAGRWIERQPVGRAVFWTSVFYRIGYIFWIPLPWLFDEQGQVWALIGIALYMGIPLTALSVGFNALFASSVPAEWRAHVVGIRNGLFSITFIGTSLGCGYLLNHIEFPQGYQLVFTVGFIGAAMSSFHLFFVRPLKRDLPLLSNGPAPNGQVSAAAQLRPWMSALRLDIWKTRFRRNLLVLMGFHSAQYLAIPLFSIYVVRKMHLSDDAIGLGNALFYLMVLLTSVQLHKLVGRHGNKNITGYGVIGLALYPLILAFSTKAWEYYGLSILGGLAWGLVGGSYANYLLENTPAHDRPSHFAWYNVVLNAAILFGSLAGPAIADGIGLMPAMILFGLLRLLAGAAILQWG